MRSLEVISIVCIIIVCIIILASIIATNIQTEEKVVTIIKYKDCDCLKVTECLDWLESEELTSSTRKELYDSLMSYLFITRDR